MAGERPLHLDPQGALRDRVAQCALSVVHVIQNDKAAPVIGFAVERRPHRPRCPQQQGDAQPSFELPDDLRGGGARDVEVVRGLREAPPVDHPNKQPHRIEPVHAPPIVRRNGTVLPLLARLSSSFQMPSGSLGRRRASQRRHGMSKIRVADGEKIYFKDWGEGPVVAFSHGWPLNSDAWEAQMMFLAQHGYRVIAHDRRGHGRSSQPSSGNNMDTLRRRSPRAVRGARPSRRNIVMVGHSTGGGEVARYIGRHGTEAASRARFSSAAVPPVMV